MNDLFNINIETDRLFIHKVRLEYLEDALEHRLDEEVSRYTSDPMIKEDVVKFYDERTGKWKGNDNEWLNLAVVLKENGKVIGELGFYYVSFKNALAEFGYRLNAQYHRKGYSFEAAKAFSTLLFEKNYVHKLMAVCDTRNIASYKFMEKLGMSREAHFTQHRFRRGEWIDEYVYGLVNTDYNTKTKSK